MRKKVINGRTTNIQVRITQTEKEILEDFSTQLNVSQSELLRGFIAQLPNNTDGLFPITFNNSAVFIDKNTARVIMKQITDRLVDF